MGIFTRFKNMVRGKANAIADELENPIEQLDLKIKDMNDSLAQAKLSSATVFGNNNQIRADVEKLEKEVSDYDNKVKIALGKGEESLAKRALEKKIETDKKLANKRELLKRSDEQCKTLKDSIRSMQDEITNLENYKIEAAGRYTTAEASKKMGEILADVTSKTNSISLKSIEDKLAQKEAQAQGMSEVADLGKDSLDEDFKKLETTVDLDAELEKYKQNK